MIMYTNPKSVIDSYDKAAESYLKWRLDPTMEIFIREKEAICKLIPNVSGCKILDLGCGPGVYSAIVSLQGAQVCSIDASSGMITQANDFLKSQCAQSTLILGTADALPFKSSCFEGIIASFLLENLPDIDHALLEITRVTKPNGFMLFSMNHPFMTFLIKIEVMEDKSLRFVPGDYFRKTSFNVRLALSNDRPEILHLHHRTFARYLNSIAASGVSIERIEEVEVFQRSDHQYLAGLPFVMVVKCRKM